MCSRPEPPNVPLMPLPFPALVQWVCLHPHSQHLLLTAVGLTPAAGTCLAHMQQPEVQEKQRIYLLLY